MVKFVLYCDQLDKTKTFAHRKRFDDTAFYSAAILVVGELAEYRSDLQRFAVEWQVKPAEFICYRPFPMQYKFFSPRI